MRLALAKSEAASKAAVQALSLPKSSQLNVTPAPQVPPPKRMPPPLIEPAPQRIGATSTVKVPPPVKSGHVDSLDFDAHLLHVESGGQSSNANYKAPLANVVPQVIVPKVVVPRVIVPQVVVPKRIMTQFEQQRRAMDSSEVSVTSEESTPRGFNFPELLGGTPLASSDVEITDPEFQPTIVIGHQSVGQEMRDDIAKELVREWDRHRANQHYYMDCLVIGDPEWVSERADYTPEGHHIDEGQRVLIRKYADIFFVRQC